MELPGGAGLRGISVGRFLPQPIPAHRSSTTIPQAHAQRRKQRGSAGSLRSVRSSARSGLTGVIRMRQLCRENSKRQEKKRAYLSARL